MLRFTCNINCCKFAIFSRLYENLLLAKKTFGLFENCNIDSHYSKL